MTTARAPICNPDAHGERLRRGITGLVPYGETGFFLQLIYNRACTDGG